MEPGIHASIPSSCSKHNRKIHIQVNTVQASDLEMRAETHNFSLKKVSNAQLFGARKSILLFEWTICVKYNRRYTFFDKVGTPYRHLKISISQVTCRRMPKHRTFPWSKKKKTKCEWRATETLINNYLFEERAFYRLNEQFVSNMTGDIIFSTRSDQRLQTINISQAACRCVQNTELFLEVKHN